MLSTWALIVAVRTFSGGVTTTNIPFEDLVKCEATKENVKNMIYQQDNSLTISSYCLLRD